MLETGGHAKAATLHPFPVLALQAIPEKIWNLHSGRVLQWVEQTYNVQSSVSSAQSSLHGATDVGALLPLRQDLYAEEREDEW